MEGLPRLDLRQVGGDPPSAGLVGVRPQVAGRRDLPALPRREPQTEQPVGAERRQGGVDLAHADGATEGEQADQDGERVAAPTRRELGRKGLLAAQGRHGDRPEPGRHRIDGEVGRGQVRPQCRQEHSVDDGRGTHGPEGMPCPHLTRCGAPPVGCVRQPGRPSHRRAGRNGLWTQRALDATGFETRVRGRPSGRPLTGGAQRSSGVRHSSAQGRRRGRCHSPPAAP